MQAKNIFFFSFFAKNNPLVTERAYTKKEPSYASNYFCNYFFILAYKNARVYTARAFLR
jgi:hypothetical protein